MRMYPEHDLFTHYHSRTALAPYQNTFPDITKRYTLEQMNRAINLCEQWEHCMDIGGGNGHYLTALAAKFKKATLIEVDNFPEHATLNTLYPNITIFQSYIEKYQSELKADFILMADLFEHIPDIKKFVHQLATLQTTGGVVYIMTPNPLYCGPAPESGIYHTHHPHGHIKHYTHKEIIALMESAGYRFEALWYEEAPFRQKVKRLLSGLFRRDSQWQKYFFYRVIRLLLLPMLYTVRLVAGKLVYQSDQRHMHNPLITMTHDLVFKKT